MSLTITHCWKCDLCGDVFNETCDKSPRHDSGASALLPVRWTLVTTISHWTPGVITQPFPVINEKIICPKHAITAATVNGDTVSIKAGSAAL